jgi:hypothetical protein
VSVAVTVQVTVSPGWTVLAVSVTLAPLPRLLPPFVQAYASETLLPSSSLALPVQVRISDVVTPLLGLMDTLSTTGSVLSTVTVAASLPVPPSLSVAVTVQVTVSPGWTVLGVKVTLAPEPRLLPPFVQA